MQPDEINQSIGQNVAYLRTKAGWSQAQLAEYWGGALQRKIDPTTVTRLERGKRPIAVHELTALAAVFGLPAWDDLTKPSVEYRRQSELFGLQKALHDSFERIREATHEYLELQVHMSLSLRRYESPRDVIYQDSEHWLQRPPEEAVVRARMEQEDMDRADQRDAAVGQKVDGILAELRRVQGEDFLPPTPESWPELATAITEEWHEADG